MVLSSTLCAYDTVKYVHIQDARLGLLRVSMFVGIFLYVVIYEMLCLGGYLDANEVIGVSRFSLQQPTINNCDPFNNATCYNAFTPLNELDYCQQSYDDDEEATTGNSSSRYQGNVFPCEIYEAVNAQIVRENSLIAITRGGTRNETLICDTSSSTNTTSNRNGQQYTCPRTYQSTPTVAAGDRDVVDSKDNNYKFYTAQTEAFTVLVDHAVTSAKICASQGGAAGHYACSAESAHYHGRLYTRNTDLCQEEYGKNNSYVHCRGTALAMEGAASCYIEPNRTAQQKDFFSLDVLLRAAGVTLDMCSSIDQKNMKNATNSSSDHDHSQPCQTYRETGATLLLNIWWSDFQPFTGKTEPHYFYSSELVGSSFKESIPYYHSYRDSRTLLNAHGIRIAVLLGGEFNQFNLINFLITLTTALGLLAVATTIVDSLMLYVLPEKARYQQVKYEVTDQVVFEGPSTLEQIVHRPLSAMTRQRMRNVDDGETNNDEEDQQEQEETIEQQQENSLEEPLLLHDGANR